MAHDVVGVRVAAVLVVGGEHLRPELADHLHQRAGRHVRVVAGERFRRELLVALGQAGVDEAQPDLVDAEDLGGLLHLRAPQLGQVRLVLRAVHPRVQDRAALAAGAGGHQHLDALRDVVGGGRGALARLVVRVGVDVQEPKVHAPILDNSRRGSNPAQWRMDVVTDDAATRVARRYPETALEALVDPGGRSCRRRCRSVGVARLGGLLRRHRHDHRPGGRLRGPLRHHDLGHRHRRPAGPGRGGRVPAVRAGRHLRPGRARPGSRWPRAAPG